MNGRYYGNQSEGLSFSPDRSRDVDRFNPSTRGNYTYFNPCQTYVDRRERPNYGGGWYDGAGRYHEK